jgi:predicted site-specific integrase-resolvase
MTNTAQQGSQGTNDGPSVHLRKLGLFGGVSFEDEMGEELKKLNKEANQGTVWLRGPHIQLSASEQEKICTWAIPEGHSFSLYKTFKENAEDVTVKVQPQRHDHHNRSAESTARQYNTNYEGPFTTTSTHMDQKPGATSSCNQGSGESKAAIEITVSRNSKAVERERELPLGRKRKCDSNVTPAIVQVLIYLKEHFKTSLQPPSQAATSIAVAQGAALGNTQVAKSQNLDAHIASERKPTPCIKRDGDFEDIVTMSTIFADKSLFIKDIMEDGDTVLLLAMPRRWGKTVNLDMLKRFLEISADDNDKVIDDGIVTTNYQIFREKYVLHPDGGKSVLKISQSKILLRNSKQEVDALKLQGTYPVIYIDFKSCKSDCFDTVRKGVRRVLNSCFREHCYLKESNKLDEDEKEKFKRYFGMMSSQGLDDDEIRSGLQVLSQMLYQHYDKKKVWILIDEYDAVANVAYSEFDTDDLDKTIKLFAGIYETALKGNMYLEKGVLTGVQYIVQSGMLSGLNNLGKFNFTDAKYAQHYGLDQSEVDLFFNHFSVPKPLCDKAKFWYNGYKVQKHNGNLATSPQELISKYNIWSIISYLKRGELYLFKSHWEESGNIDFLDNLVTKPEVREWVEKLVDGGCISFARKDDFSAEDFKQLKNMINGNKEIAPDGLAVLFSYLFIGGYLTIDGHAKNSYKLPNMEITHGMGKRLIEYYQHICRIDLSMIHSVTNAMQNIMSQPNQERMQECVKDFYVQFTEVIRSVRLVGDKNEEGVFANKDFVHSQLNYIALQMQHTMFGSNLFATKLYSKQQGQADIKVTNKDMGVIIEIKCVSVSNHGRNHMKEALKQAMTYCNLLDTHKNLFITINVRRGMSTSEERTIEFLCVSAINAWVDNDTFGVDNNIIEGFTGNR